jgi:hypothetical protein
MSAVEAEEAIDQRRLEETVARAGTIAAGAFATAPSGWRDRVRAAVQTLLAFLDDEPAAASILLVDGLSTPGQALACHAQVINTLSTVVDEGWSEAREGHEHSRCSASVCSRAPAADRW